MFPFSLSRGLGNQVMSGLEMVERRGSGGFRGLGLCIVLGSGAFGCENAAVKACHAAMTASQKSLLELKKEDRANVEAALTEVKMARDACAHAERPEESKKVADAVRSLENHLEALDERAKRVPKKEISEAEQKELERKGDPTCPRGEGYQLGKPPRMIKCTGKTMIEMTRSEVRALLEADGYHLLSGANESVVRAEHGSKVFEVQYADPASPPRCLKATPKPGVPWHETASRLTGVPQKRLTIGEEVPTPRGKMMLKVSGGTLQEQVLLGECGP